MPHMPSVRDAGTGCRYRSAATCIHHHKKIFAILQLEERTCSQFAGHVEAVARCDLQV